MGAVVDKKKKKAFLLKAAAGVFSKRGFHATTMQEIAVASNVAKGTLYEYFSTKEDLFLAIYDGWMTEYELLALNSFNEAEDPLAKTDALRNCAVQFYVMHKEYASLLLEFWAHALRSDDKRFFERINRVRQLLTTLGEKITEEMVKSGFFSTVHSPSFTLLESGISDGIFLSWILSGEAFSLEKAYEFRQSIIGLGLLSNDAREIIGRKLQKKLEEGFLGSGK